MNYLEGKDPNDPASQKAFVAAFFGPTSIYTVAIPPTVAWAIWDSIKSTLLYKKGERVDIEADAVTLQHALIAWEEAMQSSKPHLP